MDYTFDAGGFVLSLSALTLGSCGKPGYEERGFRDRLGVKTLEGNQSGDSELFGEVQCFHG